MSNSLANLQRGEAPSKKGAQGKASLQNDRLSVHLSDEQMIIGALCKLSVEETERVRHHMRRCRQCSEAMDHAREQYAV